MRREIFKMKKLIVKCLALSSLLMTACQSQPMLMPQNQFQPALNTRSAQFNAQSSAGQIDPVALQKLVERIYKQNFADDVVNLKELEKLSKQLEAQGISIYNILSANPDVRSQAYPVANKKVIEEFNKPGHADQVAPVSAEELKYLMARMQPGDVILCGNDGSFVHSALYLGNGEIVHALATQPDRPNDFYGVVKESLIGYTQRSDRDTFVVLRPKNVRSSDVQQAAQFALAQRGKTYDTLFLMHAGDRFYCTELVWQALQRMSNKPRVFPHKVQFGWEMVTVEDFMDSPDFQTVWERNRRRSPIGQLHRY